MAYDRAQLVAEIKRELTNRPAEQLSEIARRLSVDRHTLARALKDVGLTFRVVRAVAIRRALACARSGPRPMIQKELGAALGFRSRRSVRKWNRTWPE